MFRKCSPGLIAAAGGGGEPPPPVIPFDYDSDTYWWDFAAVDNTIDTSGTSTLAFSSERISGLYGAVQQNKSQQPLSVVGGINFNKATNRVLTLDNPPSLTNGKNGWYFAAVFTPTTSGTLTLMEIARASSSTASRMQIYFTSPRNLILKGNAVDSATVNTVANTPALTLGVKYAVEVLWDFVADTISMWVNGVAQTLTIGSETGPWGSFPATNPSQVLIGNASNGGTSMDGVFNNLIFHDGVPSGAIRSSIAAYNLTR